MSKIICDVCGTSYPDTAAQCPICGCAKPADATAFDSTAENVTEAAGSYTYVKGGRFSKSNVRKRNKGNAVPVVRAKEEDPDDEPLDNGNKSNKGLVIAVLVLLLAIVAVVIYIAVRFFLPAYGGFGNNDSTTAATTTVATTTEETEDDGLIHCTGLNVTDTVISFTDAGQAWKLNVQAEPADTTDVITYASSDESVAMVSEEGIVTAVGSGDATITITCGAVVVECQVECSVDTTPTTEATVPETTVPETTVAPTTTPREYTLRINGSARKSYDVTIKVGGSFTLTLTDQDGNIVDVDWQNSGPSYVSVNGNTIKGKAPAKYVKISTELDGKTYECIVRVSK